jgi:CheY-like chemotaxis protein
MKPQGDAMKQEFRILLLESVKYSAALVRYELSKAETRFTLAWVEDQESFFRALQEFCPDLILADGRLSHSDGLMALALAQDICPGVPFLFLSGDMSPATRRAWPKIINFLAAAGQEPRNC